MKKVFSIIAIVCIMFLCFGVLTGCEDKDKKTANGSDVSTSKYEWPDLENYNIPKFEKGNITELTESEGQDGYIFNYRVKLSSVTKEDIDTFCDSFEDWTVTEGESNIYIVRADRVNRYSVVISFDEKEGTAEIVMTAI